MAYLGLDAKKLLQNVANSQVLAGQPVVAPQTAPDPNTPQPGQQNTVGLIDASSSAPTQAPPSVSGKAAPSSGTFTNIQNYAKKNVAGSNQLSGAVGKNLQTAAEKAKSNIAQTQQKFGTEVESGSLQGRDTAVQEALKVAQQAAGGVQQQATRADLQAVYKQPIESLQAQIARNNAATPSRSSGGAIIQSLSPESNVRAQQDLEMYQGLANAQQAPQSIPDILKNASTYEGDVSEQRFKDIINASYKGPGNLYDIKGYEQAVSDTKESERRNALISARGIDSSLLDTVFKGKGRDYTSGQKNLDQLLLGTPDKLQQLQATKAGIGSAQDVLTAAEAASRADALSRTDLINQLKAESRGNVQGVATARSGQVEDRLSKVVQNWDKLPQYFRDALVKKTAGSGTTKLSEIEAQILGVSSGEGLYNKIRDLGINQVLKTTAADKESLISVAEQSQLAKLQQLAEMGDTRGVAGDDLSFTSAYQNADKAGRQNAFSAMDTQNLRNILNEAEAGFRDSANLDIKGTGIGQDRYKSGFRSKTVTERANAAANVKDVLSKAGYDFNRAPSQQVGDPRIAAALGQLTRTGNFSTDSFGWGDVLGDPAGTSAEIDSVLGIGKDLSLTSNINKLLDLQNKGYAALGKIPGIKNVAIPAGNAISSATSRIFGSGSGNARNTATRNAQKAAQADLSKKFDKYLADTGFANRLEVDDEDSAVRARRLQLMQTLAGIDATNTQRADARSVENPFGEDILSIAKRINASSRRA